jgi:16S rRNA processing protein RimM
VAGPDRLEIGRIVKPHGVRGEVVVWLVTDRAERVAPGSSLEAAGRELVVRSSRPHQGRWLVAFDGVDDRSAADGLAGASLRAAPIVDSEALWVHELIGAETVTADGKERGRVVAVEANPAHDILVLESGVLVPVVFVAGWDGDGRLRVEPPEGLFET